MEGGVSKLQIRAAIFLIGTFLAGSLIRYWQERQPLPEVDPAKVQQFQHLADSLNRVDKHGESRKLSEDKKQETPASGLSGRIDINRASKEQLMSLPGIGAVIAERIIAYREQHGPFTQAEQLLNVKGIGPAKLRRLRDRISY